MEVWDEVGGPQAHLADAGLRVMRSSGVMWAGACLLAPPAFCARALQAAALQDAAERALPGTEVRAMRSAQRPPSPTPARPLHPQPLRTHRHAVPNLMRQVGAQHRGKHGDGAVEVGRGVPVLKPRGQRIRVKVGRVGEPAVAWAAVRVSCGGAARAVGRACWVRVAGPARHCQPARDVCGGGTQGTHLALGGQGAWKERRAVGRGAAGS